MTTNIPGPMPSSGAEAQEDSASGQSSIRPDRSPVGRPRTASSQSSSGVNRTYQPIEMTSMAAGVTTRTAVRIPAGANRLSSR
ncbi:hypothetical protein GCM10012279_23120 [Micromonospora yangpuensis]|nr:hypothetical protein GCM10012279_23120 [Micromonospora yangpuensis]